MKHLYIYIIIGLFVTGCKKDHSTISTIQKSFSDSVNNFLKVSLSDTDYNTLDVNSMQVLKIRGKTIGVRIFEKNRSINSFIILKSESGTFKGHRVNISGLNSKALDGKLSLEALDKKSSTNFIIENNKVIQIVSTDNNGLALTTLPARKISGNVAFRTEIYELPEVVIIAYRPSQTINFTSLYWLLDQNAAFDKYYTSLENLSFGNGDSGGGSTMGYVEAAPTIYSPDKPVTDLKSEVKCFTDDPSATYTISINVNQPIPGSRELYEPFATFPVGHTYLTLQQLNADGSTIVRNVGFYPKNSVKPGRATGLATFGDDSDTQFDVSLKITVSGSDFSTVVNTLTNQQSINYDLNKFNCTSSAISALGSINVNLPNTNSGSILFNGTNPADLGEDIRAINLNEFSANNGGRKIVRIQSNDNINKPPPKIGGC